MAWFRYWQRTPDSEWEVCTARDYPGILASEEPPFTTVLELDAIVDEAYTAEDYARIKYRGDFYVDFDGESLEEVIPQAQRFLSKLEEKGINPQDLEIAATGGRGFHILVPIKCFIRNPNSAGYQHLPQIFKEMAYELVVDTLDMRVYSAKRGRMWRTYGVRRPNGKYKVPLSVEEFLEMTPELYDILCSEPREHPERPEFPTFAAGLSTSFLRAKEKVDAGAKKRSKQKGGDLDRFKGKAPASIASILSGESVSPEAGFQNIAMQLAIAAHALGWEEDRFLGAAQGLCDTYEHSNGHRYNSPQKRKKELRRMYQYMDGNPCYDFGVGGIASIGGEDLDVGDLRPTIGPERTDEDELEEFEVGKMSEGTFVRKNGIWVKRRNKETGEEEVELMCEVGFSNVTQIMRLSDDQPEGFEVTMHHGGKEFKSHISNNDFESRVAFRRSLGAIAHVRLTDLQCGGLQTVFETMAKRGGRLMYSVATEGVNVFKRPKDKQDPKGLTNFWVWWLSKDGVFYFPEDGEVAGEPRYRFDPPIEANQGMGRTDLLQAPRMQDNTDTRRLLDTLFEAYPENVVGKCFGWYVAAFLCPFFRYHWDQFPVLQCYGTAGSGKTSLNYILAHLHTHILRPTLLSTPHLTEFAMSAPLASSSSIPVLYDEVKFREMSKSRGDMFKTLVRNNYNGNAGSKGTVNKGNGRSSLGVVETKNIAPLAFMTEAQIDQEAILHRSVLVDFPHTQITGDKKSADFYWAKAKSHMLGGLGRILLEKVMRLRVEGIYEHVEAIREPLSIEMKTDARSVYNLAVVIFGLEVLGLALKDVFGDRYDEKIEALKKAVAVKDEGPVVIRKTMSETARVINTLAHLSAKTEDDPISMVMGTDWEYSDDTLKFVDIHIRNAWDKYARHCRIQGTEPLFDSDRSFMDAMYRHPAKVDSHCLGSPLKKGRAIVPVFRYSLDKLADEGVEDFHVGGE